MRRFRHWRRRHAALALLALAATTAFAAGTGIGASASASESERERQPRFAANEKKVRSGARVKVRGQFGAQPTPTSSPLDGEASNSRPPAKVRIQFKPAGKRGYRRVAETGTDREGRYAHRVKVRRSGHLRAVASDGRASRADRVRVKSRVNARLAGKHVKAGDRLRIRGKVVPAIKKRKVVVRIGGKKVTTKANRKGKFKARWKAKGAGVRKVTVKARGDKIAAGSRDRAGRAIVYRPAQASYYGPGFYGNRTACGQTLSRGTVGVAHKTLPCGTKLRMRYGNRTVKVKVIDRGPYAGNREWDLTEATKDKLGFPSTGVVWTSK